MHIICLQKYSVQIKPRHILEKLMFSRLKGLIFMVAYFCPFHASYFSTDYVNMQDTYVNMQDNYVNMQDNYVNMQDKNKKQFIYVNMQDIYVNMKDTYENMQDNYVNMQDNYVVVVELSV